LETADAKSLAIQVKMRWIKQLSIMETAYDFFSIHDLIFSQVVFEVVYFCSSLIIDELYTMLYNAKSMQLFYILRILGVFAKSAVCNKAHCLLV